MHHLRKTVMLATTRMMRRRSRTLLLLNLSVCRGFHDLLPCPETDAFHVSGDHFVRRMKEAGISKIAFLRHGKTAPASDGVDFNRQLTDEGRLQAKEAGASFGRHDLTPYFPTVLLSPAPRTVETAEIFLEAAGVKDSVMMKRLPVAYDGTMQPEGSALFKKIGYAPLLSYVDNKDDASDRKTAQRLLALYALNIAEAVYDVTISAIDDRERSGSLNNSPTFSSGSTLLFVGHAIYLPAAALGVASLARCDNDASKDLLLSSVTREAEGYFIDLDQSTVRYLSRPDRATHQCFVSS